MRALAHYQWEYPKSQVEFEFGGESHFVLGEMNYKPSTYIDYEGSQHEQIYLKDQLWRSDGRNHILYLNNQIYFLSEDSKYFGLVALNPMPLDGEIPESLEYSTVPSKDGIDIVVSAKGKSREETCFYRMIKNSETWVRHAYFSIPDQFYSQQELSYRLIVENNDNYFDHLTSNSDEFNRVDYLAKYDKTSPHLSMDSSFAKGKMSIGFISPSRSYLILGDLYYHEYNHQGMDRFDGLYVRKKEVFGRFARVLFLRCTFLTNRRNGKAVRL